MTGYRSPGRRETSRLGAGKPYREATYAMRGNVPPEFEEDKEFFLLFQESKRLQAKLPATQDKYNAVISRLVARGRELVPPKTELASPAGEPSYE